MIRGRWTSRFGESKRRANPLRSAGASSGNWRHHDQQVLPPDRRPGSATPARRDGRAPGTSSRTRRAWRRWAPRRSHRARRESRGSRDDSGAVPRGRSSEGAPPPRPSHPPKSSTAALRNSPLPELSSARMDSRAAPSIIRASLRLRLRRTPLLLQLRRAGTRIGDPLEEGGSGQPRASSAAPKSNLERPEPRFAPLLIGTA